MVNRRKKRRAGTENVPAIIGFATAVQIANDLREEKRALYNRFKQIMLDVFTQEKLTYHVNGDVENSLPHLLNVSFTGMEVESFLVNLDMAGICVSSGSACTAGSIDPSHVLVAMFGQGAEELRNSIRFSFGQDLTEEDIRYAAEKTAAVVKKTCKKIKYIALNLFYLHSAEDSSLYRVVRNAVLVPFKWVSKHLLNEDIASGGCHGFSKE